MYDTLNWNYAKLANESANTEFLQFELNLLHQNLKTQKELNSSQNQELTQLQA